MTAHTLAGIGARMYQKHIEREAKERQALISAYRFALDDVMPRHIEPSELAWLKPPKNVTVNVTINEAPRAVPESEILDEAGECVMALHAAGLIYGAEGVVQCVVGRFEPFDLTSPRQMQALCNIALDRVVSLEVAEAIIAEVSLGWLAR